MRDPMWDTGTGADITDIGTRRHITAQDLVADVVGAKAGATSWAEVCEGAMVQTPTPQPRWAEKIGAIERPGAKEGGWHRQSGRGGG